MTTTRGQDVWRFRACCALALALLVCAYANSLDNAFHFDDTHVVENNLYLRNLRNIPLFFRDASTFSSVPTNATYRPLVTTSLAIDYWLGGGLGVRQFHRSQLALLAALAVMVFFLFKRLLDTPFFATPEDNGSFTIPDVPPGQWVLVGWHERVGERQTAVQVERGKAATVEISLPVEDGP